MFENIKILDPKQMITIDHPDVIDLAGHQDFTVLKNRVLCQDEGELCITDLHGFWLVSHTFHGSPVYRLYELTDDLVENFDEFPEKIHVRQGRKEIVYVATISPVYDMECADNLAEEWSYCEYKNKQQRILIEQTDTIFNVYQGFRLHKESIIL